MGRVYISLVGVLATCFSFILPGAEAARANDQTHADLVLTNAAIYTVDGSRRWAQAIAVANGKIVYVGTPRGVEPFTGPLTNIFDLEGKLVLPGFCDSHVHPISSTLEEAECSLIGCESKDDIYKVIDTYVKEHPDKKWICGSGWELPFFQDAAPRKEDLDRLVPDRPAFFSSADGHSAWVNSKALELAGIDKSTPDPQSGRIEHDPINHEPAGTLRESAISMVSKLLPEVTADQYREAAFAAQKKLNSLGIIAVQEADANEKILQAYSSLDSSNLLTMRVRAALYVDPAKGVEQIVALKALRDKFSGNLLQPVAVKIFADGVIEAKTAAILEPYIEADGQKSNVGLLNLSPDLFKQLVTKLEREKFQVHVHAIGDRAVRASLDAFADARKNNGINDLRHHIAHLELIHPDDVSRFRDLNVTANFQPFWAYCDKYMSELTEPILGRERMKRVYPMRSVYKSGAVLVAGSDWSVTSLNPLDAIQVAITRCGLNEPASKVFLPEERLSLPEIIAAYTINGAYLMHNENETGSLEVGKSADLIILDKNIFTIPPSEIHKTKVLMTVFRGREVYRHPAF